MKERVVSLLRWSEKYTKTDMLYLTKGGFWLSIGTVASAFSSFALSIAFANLISPESYGMYKYALSLSAIFGTFTLTGLETAVMQSSARGKEGVLKEAFLTNILWSIPMAIVATAGASYYFIQGNLILATTLALIAIAQPLTTSAALGAAYLMGKKVFPLSATYYTARSLVPMVALITTTLLSENPILIIAVYFLSNLLTAMVTYFLVTKILKPNNESDSEAMTYAKHLSITDVWVNVADNFDKLITFKLLGPASLATYSLALAFPSQSKLITKSLYNLIFPKFAERSEHEVRQAMHEKVLRFFLIGFVMATSYILIAPHIFKLIYPRYMEAVFLSQIYAVSLMGMAGTPVAIFLGAHKKIRSQYAVKIITSIFQLISAVIGIYLAGLLGLVVSRVATRFVGGIIATICYYTDY